MEGRILFRYFFSLVTLIYIPVLFYAGYHLWQTCRAFFPAIRKTLFWPVFLLGSASFILSRSMGRVLPDFLAEGISLTSYYWLIGVFYLVLAFIVLDLLSLLDHLCKDHLNLQKRRPYLNLLAVLLVVCLLVYGTWNAASPRVTRYEIFIPKETGLDEMRIVMVSDLHLGRAVNNKRLQEMVEKINNLNPDIVVIPGDIIQDSQVFVEQNMTETLQGLKTKWGVFMSLGNHEYYGGAVKDTVGLLEQAGGHILQDEYMLVADSIFLIGRNDPAVNRSAGKMRKDLSQIMTGIDKELPLILLNHQPTELEEAEKLGVDLQLSGHTHNGQVFPANLVTSGIYEQDWGYLQKGRLQLIVSCGFGTWGPPLRIGSKSEIVEILVHFGGK